MSAIKVNFEIGHIASLRSKKTPEGFTHDWEVFVRGQEGVDISHFVDKVVFHLHESFPKPKRGEHTFFLSCLNFDMSFLNLHFLLILL